MSHDPPTTVVYLEGSADIAPEAAEVLIVQGRRTLVFDVPVGQWIYRVVVDATFSLDAP